jgi:hypothetical protein
MLFLKITYKDKSLVRQFKSTLDAQGIYRELKKHVLSLIEAKLLGDTLLQDIKKTRFPQNWNGEAYDFVLHWKQQDMRYEALAIEENAPKQKLRLLQYAVSDVPELAYVEQFQYQDMARGNTPADFEDYMKLLMLECSTYDKKIPIEENPRRNVLKVSISADDGHNPSDDTLDG